MNGAQFDRRWERQCTRKHAYATQARARRAAASAALHFGHPMKVYRCEICHGFHLARLAATEMNGVPSVAKQVLNCPSCGAAALAHVHDHGIDFFMCARCGEVVDADRVPGGFVAVVEDRPTEAGGAK